MSTILTTPAQLGNLIRASSSELQGLAQQCGAIQRQMEALLDDGYTPLATKTQIDLLLVPVGASLDAIRAQLDNYSFKAVEIWRKGSPPGIGWLRCGYSNDNVFLTATGVAQGLHMILYNDVGPNISMFLGVVVNDVISVSGARENDGRYTIKWIVAAKGSNVAYGLENGDFAAATGWTETATYFTIGGGKASFADASTTTPRTLTNALSGMTASAAYTVQFKLSNPGGVGTFRVSLGGDYYWQMDIADIVAGTTYSFTTNAPSTTPTLTFTGTRASGTCTVDVDDVEVYGAPCLFVVEDFAVDAGAGNDASCVVTLEQTAA